MKRLALLALTLIVVLSACGSRDRSKTESDQPPLENSDPLEENSSKPEEAGEELPNTSSSNGETETPATLKLVVPEGYTLARVGMKLEELGVCTTREFIDATENGDFSEFPLIQEQVYSENRAFKLEGYLFPATYDIYSIDSPDTIIRKMLAHTETQISLGLRDEIKNRGYTVDEIIILASIIEKEAYERNDNPVPKEMPRISSVLHNRLDTGMMLQCDVTINYVEGAIKPFIDGDKDWYNEYYNTYKAAALPAGAICNPGLDAITAAANPADTEYLFFLTDNDKNFYYSSNFEDHRILVSKYL